MVVTKFEEISMQAQKRGKCVGCGKTCKRQQRIYETLNPWNKHGDGSVKDRKDILISVRIKVIAWESEPLICTKCE